MSAPPFRMLAVPRDPNPYQETLYAEMRRLGVEVRYGATLTPSRTLNLLLLPAELAVARTRGWRVLHVHWVFGFALPGSRRAPFLRRVAQAWFELVLATARGLGTQVVWTAHNVLPHDRVFHDDVAARRALVDASALVIAHSDSALAGLRDLVGAAPRRGVVIPHGPPAEAPAVEILRPPGSGEGPRTLAFVGKILDYKGVEDLIAAAARLGPSFEARIVVAGDCPDAALRARLRSAADRLGGRVQLRLGWLPGSELADLLASADAIALPFRRVTTSGSALLAMAYGRPVVLPDLPAFEELPDAAVLRYDGSVGGLAEMLERVAGCPARELREYGAAAAGHVRGISWSDAARRTTEAVAECLAA
jgi:glycosyltransferase involved in cell wall biosynthesis